MSQPRLIVDTGAVVANWRALATASGAATCGAALKADGYGLGARPLLAALADAGCRDVFVASWAEAAALGPLPANVRVAVLHGITPPEMDQAAALGPAFAPILNTPAQAALWRQTGCPADAMVDTGINRLGLAAADLAALDGIPLHTLHSHLACADEPAHPQNAAQRDRFQQALAHFPSARAALANSAGIGLGPAFHFGLTRPGIGLYGGGPSAAGFHPVLHLVAPVLQLRDVPAGAAIGYGASFIAPRPLRTATVALGYADGYPRALAGQDHSWGHALIEGRRHPVLGRVSMDLLVIDVTHAPAVAEGDPLEIAFDIPAAARAAGRTDYEMLTGLGARYTRSYR
ncbi:alanine racemase [Polymorphobacter sp.]|uniref:alanine racemase n=1 Tax=Polymorphobacter sp. TaxID=1909290 RepID=UPI003F7021FB